MKNTKTTKKISKKRLTLFLAIVLIVAISIYVVSANYDKIAEIRKNVLQMEELENAKTIQTQDIEVGENAIISSIEISERQTGAGPFDENDEPGNDSAMKNDIVRSFDNIKYTIEHNMELKSEVATQGNVVAYKGGIIEVKAEVPEDCTSIAKWDIESIKWTNDIQLEEDGRVLTARYAMKKNSITVPGVQSLDFTLKVLSAPNGKEIIPTFTSKLIGNSEEEVATLTDEPIIVSAAPSYNIQLVKKADLDYRSYFDPETKNEVQEATQSSIYGRMQGYAITLQLYNANEAKGLKGIELPQGDISFDLKFGEYNGQNEISQKEGYTPILWDYAENEQFDTGTNGNNLVWTASSNSNYGRQIAPYNAGGGRDACYNGGSWKIQADRSNQTLYHVTIKNYKFDMENFKFPTKNAEDPVVKESVYKNNVGCFSAGYVQVIMQMPEIIDEISNVEMRATVSNLKATSVTNQKAKDTNREDDVLKTSITLYPEGTYNKSNYFCHSERVESDTEHIASSPEQGDADIAIGENVYIWGKVGLGNSNETKIKAINVLQKFDDKAFSIPEDATSGDGKKVRQEGKLKTLYAAKPDKTGWKDDDEMQDAKEQDLIYFPSMFELQEQGYKCVGVLFEDRNLNGRGGYQYYYGIRTFISDNAEIGKVYQTVNDVTIWDYDTEFSFANKKYTYDKENGLKYEDLNYPKPLITEYNGKNVNIPRYVKTQYDENGQIVMGTHNGERSGNSILIIGADLGVKKTTNRLGYNSDQYDLASKECQVKYIITPTLTNKGNNIKGIHIKITDTLPKGLTYEVGSCNYEEPEITVNKDGTTTLVWYMYNCTVNEQIPNIYYTANIDKNTKNNTKYSSEVVISEVLNDGEKTKIGMNNLEKRKGKVEITIKNSASYSLYKMTETPGIEENGTIHYKIVASNNTDADLDTFQLLDKLPLETNGTKIELQNITVNKKKNENNKTVDIDNIKVLYTNQELMKEVEGEEDSKVEIQVTDEDFGETSIWQEIELGADLPEGTLASAIALKGTLEENTHIEIDLYLKTKNNKANDIYKNKAVMQTQQGRTRETLEVQVKVIDRIISGKVWEDYDRNGIMDYFEEKMSNVEVILYNSTNTEIDRTRTDQEGNYQFHNLAKGNYKVKVNVPTNFYMTLKGVGGLLGINNKFNQTTNTTDLIQLSENTSSLTLLKNNVNAGLYQDRYKLHITNYRAETDIKIKNTIYAITGTGIGLQGPEYKTDQDGQFEVYLVPNQTYILKQTDISTYDYMLNESPIIFKVVRVNGALQLQVQSGKIKTSKIEQTSNEEISDVYIDIENEPKYNIRITQYEKDTTNTISYVRFRVKGKDMGKEGKVYQTNVNGIAIIPSLSLDETYTVEEEYAKGYYYKNKVFTVKMVRNNGKLEIEYNGVETREEPFVEERESRPVIELSFDNVSIPKYSLELSKIGEKTGRLLPNAHFEIEGEGRDESTEKEYATAENGILTIDKLYENEIYTLKEVVPPIGYKMKEETLKFRATQVDGIWDFEVLEGQFLEDKVIEGNKIKVKYENELLFKLQKTDEETGEPLEGVKFKITDLEGKEATDLDGNPIGEIENIDGQEMRVVTTDKDGLYTAEIAQGLYKIEEVQTINGYELPEEPVQYFGIDASQEGKEGVEEIWATEFSTNNSDIIERVAITSDGGRVFGGQIGGKVATGGGTLGDSNVASYVLVKYDADGKLVWQTTCSYGYINFVKETKNGGLLVVANKGVMVFQKNTTGYTLEWEKGLNYTLRYIDETINGGFVIAGQSDANIRIERYEKSGNTYTQTWETTITGGIATSSWDETQVFITALMVTQDNGIIVGGATKGNIKLPNGEVLSNSKAVDNTVLLKYDENGNGYTFNWGKRIYGATNRITGITETTDGEYVVGGYFSETIQLSNRLELESKGERDNLVVKYDKFGNIRFGFGLGGENDEIVNHIDKMTDGGFAIAGSMSSNITLENGQEITPKGNFDAFIARFDKDAHVKWAKIYGGEQKDYFTCLDINENGRILLGTLFNSEKFTLDNGQELNGISNNVDAALIEIQEVETQPEIPETSEINYQNSKRLYNITTGVEGTGGNISGENEEPYEQVIYTKNSEKDIIITPKEGYEVSSVKVNGKEIEFTRNNDATVVLDKFTNIQEDIHVVATFTANPAQVIVHHYILNTTRSLALDEIIRGEVDKEYETKPKDDIERYEVETNELPQNAKGVMTVEPIEVTYYYSRRDAKVTVHHYLDGTTEKLAQDEEIEGRIGSEYQTQNTNIPGYDVINEKWPSNSFGSMQERETEVIYYYKKKEAKIVNNSISKNGTELMETENQKLEYTLKYNAEISDVLGNAQITITDYLPFEIDEENSNLNEGTYNKEEKTITWEETIENINTYENGNKKIEITKNIELVWKNMNYGQKSFINYAEAKITVDNVQKETGKIPARTQTNFTKNVTVIKKWNHTNNQYPLPKTVRYQLKNGETVVAEKDLTEENRINNVEFSENEDIWSWEFTNLEKYDEQGNEIDYQVEETQVNEKDLVYYQKDINQETKTITNTFIGPIISSSKTATTSKGLDYVVEGEKITYTITVENAGGLAKDVVIKDIIPKGTTFIENSVKINNETTTNKAEDLEQGITVNVPGKQEETNGKAVLSFDVIVNKLQEGTFEANIRNTAYVDDKPTPEETINNVKKSSIKVTKESNPVSGSKVKLGDKITYTIKLQNEGSVFGDIIVKDTIPSGTTFVENSIKINGEKANKTQQDLEKGIIVRIPEKQEVTVSFEVTVDKLEDMTKIKNVALTTTIPDKLTNKENPEKPIDPENPNAPIDPYDKENPINPEEPNKPTNETQNTYVEPIITTSKTAVTAKGLDYVVEGEKITYTITVENAGGLAKDVVIKDNIPEGTTFVENSIKINGETTTNTNQNLEQGITVNVPAKQEENGKTTLSFEVTVNNLLEGIFEKVIKNIAYIDDRPTPKETKTNVKKSSIKVTKESNPVSGSKVKLGDKITYTIKLQNEGIVFGNILVKDRIPAGTTFVENSIKINGEVTANSIENLEQGITVNVPERQNGKNGETNLSFEVIVNDLNNLETIKNVAYTTLISDQEVDPSEIDKPTNETQNIYVEPIITTNKTATTSKGLDYVVEGEKITYTITVENAGGLDKDVVIKDIIPEGTTFIENSVKINNETTTNKAEDLEQGIAVNVPAKQEENGKVVLSFDVRVNKLQEGTFEANIRNTAYVDDKPTPEETRNNVKKSEIKVTKESTPASGSKVKVGDKITYAIKLKNEGSVFGDIVVKDVIPSGTTFVENSIKINGEKANKTQQDIEKGIIVRIPEKQEIIVSFEVTVDKLEDMTKIKNVALTTTIPDKLTNKENPEKPIDPENPNAPIDPYDKENPINPEKPTNETQNTYVEPIITTSKTAVTAKGLDYVVEGEKITYTITAENAGGLAKDVVIKDNIPEGTTFVENSIKINGETTTNTNQNLEQGITVNVPEKNGTQNGKVTLSFVVTVNELPQKVYEKTIRNTAYIDNEPTPKETINNVKKSNIKTSKENIPVSGSKVKVGDKITYTIKLQNVGNIFGDIIIKDTIPKGTTFIENSIKVNGESIEKAEQDLIKGIIVRVLEKQETTLSFEVIVNDIENMTKIKNVALTTTIPDKLTNQENPENPIDPENPNTPIDPYDKENPINPKEQDEPTNETQNIYVEPVITTNKAATTSKGLDYVVEGEKITYTITVQNEGGLEKDVVIKDAIPEGTTFVENSIKINGKATTNTAEELSKGINVNIPKKVGTQNGKVTLSFIVTVNKLPKETFEANIRNTAYIDNEPTKEETKNTVKKSEIKAIKESIPVNGSKVKVGDKITYTIRLQNEGSIFGDIIAKDTIPSGTTFIENSIKINGEKANKTKQDLEKGIIVRVPAKQEATISFEVTVNKMEDMAKINNVALTTVIPDKLTNEDNLERPIDPENPDTPIDPYDKENPINPEDKDKPTNETQNIYVEPSLDSTKISTTTKGLEYVVEGEKITYTITVQNKGGLAKETVIKDSIPEGTTFVENSIKINGETTENSARNLEQGITVNVPEKVGTQNGKVTLSFVVRVNKLLEGVLEANVRNTAYIDDRPTPEETRNHVKKSNIITAKESNPTSGSKVKVGDKITYTIKLQNVGNIFGDIIVKDVAPKGTTFIEDSIKINGQKVEKTKENLEKGIILRVPEQQEKTVSFEVVVNDIEDMAKIKNMALTTTIPDRLTNEENPETPIDPENPNTPIDPYDKENPINPEEQDKPTNETQNTYVEPIITTNKTATTEKGLNYVVEGEKITYTITVQNEGGLAKEVKIKDTIPKGTTFIEDSIQVNGQDTKYTKQNLEEGIIVNVLEKQEDVNGTANLSFSVTVDKGTTGNISNQAVIDEKTTNEVNYPIVNFEKQTEIKKISEEDLPENTVTTTDQIIYKIIVKNTGTIATQAIEVKDTIPEGTSLEQINNQGKIKDNSEIIWNLETIEAGETKELSFIVNVRYSKEEKQIKNIAYINQEATNETSTQYKKTDSKLKTTITKTGDKQIISADSNVYYEINYRAVITDLKGKATITIVDQLPYPIDLENSDLSGGIYDKETKTITWEETEENIDTYQAKIEKTIQKTIAISVRYLYEDQENLSGDIENTVKSITQLKEAKTDNPNEDEIVKTEEKTDTHIVSVQIPAQVTVHHYIYDVENNQYTTIELIEDEIKNGKIGENYTTNKSSKVPQNYECINETPQNYTGNMTKTPIQVSYYYQLKQETVNNEMTKTANSEEIQIEGNNITYNIAYKVEVKDYIGKVKVVIKDILPERINVEKSNLAGGNYNEQSKTITWEEMIENIDTFTNSTYENTINKQINVVYEGQNKIETLTNKAEGMVTTYYPENHPNKPKEEKQTIKDSDEISIKQNYKTNITVEKIWNDHENLKNHRPNSIQMQLIANKQKVFNGEELETVILTQDNNWSYTFADLNKYDSSGQAIKYEVEEQEVNVGDLKYYNLPEIITTQEMATGKIIVTNNYKLKDIKIDSNLNKDGTEEITSSDQEVNYHISYNAVVKEYIGNAILVITDTLPYKIDEEKSELSNGVYNEDMQTITWTMPINDIDTSANGDREIKVNGDIKLVYKDINPKQTKITNHLNAKLEFTEDDTKNETEDSHDTTINIRGKINVKYVDKDTGEELVYIVNPGEEGNEDGKEPITKKYGYEIEGKAGDEYTTIKHEIDTYDYLETIGNVKGEIKEGEDEVIYYYTKSPSGGATVKYVDEDGKEIIPKEEITGKIGDKYKTEEKDIENYEFVETTGDETEGNLSKEPKEILYHYKRIPATVIVKYLEKETNKILADEETLEGYAGDSYETKRKVIKDYQKAEPEPENITGTMKKEKIEVIYYYEKIPSGKVTVKYVDIETGEEIVYVDENGKGQTYSYENSGFVGEKYKTEEKDIPYYKYQNNVKESQKEAYYTQNDETIIYYYKKLKFNIGIQKEIKNASIDGNPIKISNDNKMMKVELVKTNIQNANLQITYSIKVSNTGELSGTAILYEMTPKGFTLNSSIQNDWQVHEDGNLSMTLELEPGESKEYELTFRWNNDESNFGTKTNKVAIVKTINKANFSETTTEDNQSEATAIINIKTGKEVNILIGILSSVVLLGGLVLVYSNKKKQK